jgi:hypothetical protein
MRLRHPDVGERRRHLSQQESERHRADDEDPSELSTERHELVSFPLVKARKASVNRTFARGGKDPVEAW